MSKFGDAAKPTLRGKFTTQNAYVRKEERFKINNLNFHLRKLEEKKAQIKQSEQMKHSHATMFRPTPDHIYDHSTHATTAHTRPQRTRGHSAHAATAHTRPKRTRDQSAHATHTHATTAHT